MALFGCRAPVLAAALWWILAPPLEARLGQIEAAFRGNDAGALRAACLGSGRVRLEVTGVGAAQAGVGPGQLEMLFRQAFAEQRSTAFAFDRPTLRLSPPATAFARARWSKEGRDGAPVHDILTFTLRDEGGDWRIEEIRSTR